MIFCHKKKLASYSMMASHAKITLRPWTFSLGIRNYAGQNLCDLCNLCARENQASVSAIFTNFEYAILPT